MGFPGLSLLCFFEWCDAQASIKNTRMRMIVMFISLFTLLLLELSKSSSIEVTAQPIPGANCKMAGKCPTFKNILRFIPFMEVYQNGFSKL